MIYTLVKKSDSDIFEIEGFGLFWNKEIQMAHLLHLYFQMYTFKEGYKNSFEFGVRKFSTLIRLRLATYYQEPNISCLRVVLKFLLFRR